MLDTSLQAVVAYNQCLRSCSRQVSWQTHCLKGQQRNASEAGNHLPPLLLLLLRMLLMLLAILDHLMTGLQQQRRQTRSWVTCSMQKLCKESWYTARYGSAVMRAQRQQSVYLPCYHSCSMAAACCYQTALFDRLKH